MACAIAGVAATGADMRTAAALDAIAGKFLDWYAEGPPDVGMQTRHVLACTGPGPGAAARMRQAGRVQAFHPAHNQPAADAPGAARPSARRSPASAPVMENRAPARRAAATTSWL
jgi:hypothetical protein